MPMKTHFINIKNLLQVRETKISFVKGKAMSVLPNIENAFLSIENEKIIGFGPMKDFNYNSTDKKINLKGKMVLPTWVDSHTHLVYAGTRESEFEDRIKGLSYQDIAEKGGGILNSAEKLIHTSETELFKQSKERLDNLIAMGTGAIEIKSGYGLTHDAEIKMLSVINKLKDYSPIPVKITYLAAHALPKDFKDNKEGYIKSIVEKTLPCVAKNQLADYIDVFCEKGYFDLNDTEEILEASEKYGLKPKIHVNQFNAFGGVELSTRYKALSVDHLEELSAEDIAALKKSNTMPVALPGCSFFLSIPYTPGRLLIDNDLPLTLASDYNPGSSPSGNMNFVVALACIKMNLLPEEAINAATINAASSLEISDSVGSISIGKLANFIITKPIPSYTFIPYSFGENHIEEVWINGKPFKA
jgi:imidazolonepropionase